MNKKCEKRRKVALGRTDFFTIRELQLLEQLKRFKVLKYAAEELGISETRAANILANIRDKWEKAINTHNKLVALCRRDEALRRLLSKPAPRKPPPTKTVTHEEEVPSE